MGLIVPGRNVVCTRDIACVNCGAGEAKSGGVYMCDEVGLGGILHVAFCGTSNCDGTVLMLKDKPCGLCSCCFKPLDDGDTSLVEDAETYDDILKDPPVKKPTRVLV